MVRFGKLGLALAVVLGAGIAAIAPAAAQPAVLEAGKDCQKFRTCDYQRGGSYLCSDLYCMGYRPSARMKASPDTGLSHSGFRGVQ